MFDYENLQSAVESGLTREWFKESADGNLYAHIAGLAEKEIWNKRNAVTVMQAGGVFDKFPVALEYFSSPPDWAYSSEDFESAIDVLRSKYASRTIITASNNAILSIGRGDDPFDAMDSITKTLAGLSEYESDRTQSIAEVATESFKIDEKIANGEPFGLPFPWSGFNRKTLGIPSKSVVPLAGRDGKGKSRLATYLAHYWAERGEPILYFPFEDTSNRMVSNVAATHGGYDMFSIRRHGATDRFMDNHSRCLSEVSKFPLYLNDYSTTVEKIVTTISRYKRKHGITGVVIDGFKDIIPSKGENQTQRENFIMAALVRAAKEYDVTIIPVMHLSKVEDDRWISKQSIKGSGTQTQSARMVLVYQDSGFPAGMTAKFTDLDGCVILECQKSNYGERGSIVLKADFKRGRFVEINTTEDEELPTKKP